MASRRAHVTSNRAHATPPRQQMLQAQKAAMEQMSPADWQDYLDEIAIFERAALADSRD